MKNNSYFAFILVTIFVGVLSVSAMERKRLNVMSEQINMEQARRDEEMRRRVRLDEFEREIDRVWQQAAHEQEVQQLLENVAEGAAR